ncbi:hypothetical protein HU200_004964 [Digitaria exilis]|uniref:Trehalose 6-phosphate phosphatase n=1 Tax=Digitaria exilis TaxID=1010633 RepID=A0A835FUX7_9POAL|nr:hypothetical protein HU200_004964 [Digitaria exilis]
MTKHAGFSSDEAVAAVVAPPPTGLHFSPFPPPTKAAARDCKKLAAVHVDITAPMAGSWFESMKDSSPRRAADAEHGDWMEKHPSALKWFEAALGAAKGKQIVMFLDYDGTLSPIVEDPDRAVMSEEMRDAVRRLAEHFPTAIVSGRCRDKVFNFVKLTELYYAGSHGMDIEGPAKQQSKHIKASAEEEEAVVQYQAGSEFLPIIEEVYHTLTAKMESIPGAMVENNKYCLSVHFRCVQEEEWNAVEEEVRSVLKEYPGLKLTHGRKVSIVSYRSIIRFYMDLGILSWRFALHQVGQGQGPRFLLKSLGYAGRSDVFPIYIGDDRTDEDAFKVKEFLCKMAKANQGDGAAEKMLT